MAEQLSKREITKLVVNFYKLTGKSPCLKHLAHLPFSKNRVMKLFGTWNNMLKISGLKLNRNKISEITCFLCKKKVARQVKEIRKSKRSFCSSECSASYYTTGRKHSEETKRKISESLKAHRIFLNTEKNN
jgi:hypothetical protein